MRELIIRQTAAEILNQARTAAIAAIGLRGNNARQAMNRARKNTVDRMQQERWEAIAKGARRSRFDRVREDEPCALVAGDVSKLDDSPLCS